MINRLNFNNSGYIHKANLPFRSSHLGNWQLISLELGAGVDSNTAHILDAMNFRSETLELKELKEFLKKNPRVSCQKIQAEAKRIYQKRNNWVG
ncbi:MAG: hypothetical protein ACD_20C00209G0008 [uncultured bacterium]|nr:MAG: hypothetical protein ACD_20C00209G0008 [uncultured bacterium]